LSLNRSHCLPRRPRAPLQFDEFFTVTLPTPATFEPDREMFPNCDPERGDFAARNAPAAIFGRRAVAIWNAKNVVKYDAIASIDFLERVTNVVRRRPRSLPPISCCRPDDFVASRFHR
jgi:hypothetical protein